MIKPGRGIMNGETQKEEQTASDLFVIPGQFVGSILSSTKYCESKRITDEGSSVPIIPLQSGGGRYML